MNAVWARVVVGAVMTGSVVASPSASMASAVPSIVAAATAPGGPIRVLVVGDSLTAQSEPAARALVADMGNPVALTVRAVPGSGLLTGFDWIGELDRLVTGTNPQIIVAEFIGNYFPPYLHDPDGQTVSPGSPAFYEAWATRTSAAMTVMTRGGATVFWVLGPDMRDPTLDTIRHGIDTIYRSQRQQWSSTQFVDGYAALSPHGYVDTLPGRRGPETVRRDDGVHLTPAGAERLVQSVAAAIATYETGSLATADDRTQPISRSAIPL